MAEINIVHRNKQRKKKKPQRRNQQNHNQRFGEKTKSRTLTGLIKK